MTQTEKKLAIILGQVLRKEKPCFNGEAYVSDLIACAAKNSVMHIVYDCLAEACNNGECDIYKLQEMQHVFNEANRTHAWNEFASAAEDATVDILMLKGISLKNYYPRPESRDMCDIDFLYKPEQVAKLESVLVSLGYTKRKATVCHDGWFNPSNGVTLEAHRILNTDTDEKSYYFADIWKRAEAERGKKHIFHMTAEDMYIHLLLHIRNHFKTDSATLRQVADLYVMKLYSGMKMEKCEKFFTELKLTVFAKNVERLADFLFESGADTDNGEIEELADCIFGNVSFGEFNTAQAREAYRSGGSKAKAFFRMAFPKADRIYKSYPFIAKHRYLLPFGYMYRLVQVMSIRRNNAIKKLRLLSGVSAASAEQGKRISEFFEKYGI